MKDYVGLAAILLFIAMCFASGCYFEYAKLSECNRVHPLWYCLVK